MQVNLSTFSMVVVDAWYLIPACVCLVYVFLASLLITISLHFLFSLSTVENRRRMNSDEALSSNLSILCSQSSLVFPIYFLLGHDLSLFSYSVWSWLINSLFFNNIIYYNVAFPSDLNWWFYEIQLYIFFTLYITSHYLILFTIKAVPFYKLYSTQPTNYKLHYEMEHSWW